MIEAWLAKTPRALIEARTRLGWEVAKSFIRTGRSGRKIFKTIGSMPICLLKLDLPRRAISLTRSVKSSGIVLAISPAFKRFFKS